MVGRSVLEPFGVPGPDPAMSRLHFRLRATPEGAVVEDLGSSNGTLLNRRRIQGATPVEPGAVLRAGETLFLVLREPPCPAASRPDAGLWSLSPAMNRLLTIVDRVATSDLSVLLLGETGSGKDVLARYLHRASGRPGPFLAVSCAAIPSGLLEASLFGHVQGAFTGADHSVTGLARAADRGTLFLDELGEMAPELQGKLLRFLETRAVIPVGAAREIPVDVRVVAATSRGLSDPDGGSTLRGDLLGRLEDLVVALPPLRDRREDILLLAEREAGVPQGSPLASADVAEALLCHPWPRNVRELVRGVRAALHLSGGRPPLRLEDLREGIRHVPEEPGVRPRGRDRSAGPDEDHLNALYESCRGNVSEMARRLGKDRRQVYRWLNRIGKGR